MGYNLGSRYVCLDPEYMIYDTAWEKINTGWQGNFQFQNTPHTSPSRASYGVSFGSTLQDNDCKILGVNCTKIDFCGPFY